MFHHSITIRSQWSTVRYLAILAILPLAINLSNVLLTLHGSRLAKSTPSYTYVNDDYPEYLPIVDHQQRAMIVEETTHYPISGPDAREEWASSAAKGFGYVRLGPLHRSFAVSMYHQFHCLRLLSAGLDAAFTDTRSDESTWHIGHCLNYLRQMILCTPDYTLEPPDVLERDFEKERVGSVHVCMDWERIYEEVAINWDEWLVTRAGNRSSGVDHTAVYNE